MRYATKGNPLAPTEQPCIRLALGFGISESGRVLRDLVHLGFNEDLEGRRVFDGILRDFLPPRARTRARR